MKYNFDIEIVFFTGSIEVVAEQVNLLECIRNIISNTAGSWKGEHLMQRRKYEMIRVYIYSVKFLLNMKF